VAGTTGLAGRKERHEVGGFREHVRRKRHLGVPRHPALRWMDPTTGVSAEFDLNLKGASLHDHRLDDRHGDNAADSSLNMPRRRGIGPFSEVLGAWRKVALQIL